MHFYSGSDEVAVVDENKEAEEVVVEEEEEKPSVVVSPVASSGNLATAFVSVPAGEFVFQWEDENGTVMSDTDSGPTDGYSGDLEVFVSPEANKIYPVVYFNGEPFKGNPLYIN